MDGNVFGVHIVPADVFTLDGTERSRAHMKRHFFPLDAFRIDVSQDALREMQSCSRSRYRTLYLGIDRLVGCLVALLSLPVEIWRDGKLSDGIDDFGESQVSVPIEPDFLARAMCSDALRREFEF